MVTGTRCKAISSSKKTMYLSDEIERDLWRAAERLVREARPCGWREPMTVREVYDYLRWKAECGDGAVVRRARGKL